MPTVTLPESIEKKNDVTYIGPQPGPQEELLSSPAEIVIFGGGAGGG